MKVHAGVTCGGVALGSGHSALTLPSVRRSRAGVVGAKAKELIALMESEEARGVRDARVAAQRRFVAVMVVPNVQMLVVSAIYSRPTDIEYRIYRRIT